MYFVVNGMHSTDKIPDCINESYSDGGFIICFVKRQQSLPTEMYCKSTVFHYFIDATFSIASNM